MPEGATLLADKGYGSNVIREIAASNGSSFRNGSTDNAISSSVPLQPVKHPRGIATRYGKCLENRLAAVKTVSMRI